MKRLAIEHADVGRVTSRAKSGYQNLSEAAPEMQLIPLRQPPR